MQEAEDLAGLARAGAAFATRRQDLGISQRELAANKVISAPALIAFEKGRAWPRERTRALLEKVVQWPAGTLARVRTGGAIPEGRPPSDASPLPLPTWADDEGAAPLVVSAVEVAMNTVAAAVASLPEPEHPRFAPGARAALADLRQLEAITAKAVRTSSGAPSVIRALASVRRRYDELMMTAARSPGATQGQRLYTARRRSNLSVAEIAEALGAPPDLVLAVERDEPPPNDYVARIEALIADLSEG